MKCFTIFLCFAFAQTVFGIGNWRPALQNGIESSTPAAVGRFNLQAEEDGNKTVQKQLFIQLAKEIPSIDNLLKSVLNLNTLANQMEPIIGEVVNNILKVTYNKDEIINEVASKSDDIFNLFLSEGISKAALFFCHNKELITDYITDFIISKSGNIVTKETVRFYVDQVCIIFNGVSNIQDLDIGNTLEQAQARLKFVMQAKDQIAQILLQMIIDKINIIYPSIKYKIFTLINSMDVESTARTLISIDKTQINKIISECSTSVTTDLDQLEEMVGGYFDQIELLTRMLCGNELGNKVEPLKNKILVFIITIRERAFQVIEKVKDGLEHGIDYRDQLFTPFFKLANKPNSCDCNVNNQKPIITKATRLNSFRSLKM